MDVLVLDSKEEEEAQDHPAETAPPAYPVSPFLRTAHNLARDVMLQSLFTLTNASINGLLSMQVRPR